MKVPGADLLMNLQHFIASACHFVRACVHGTMLPNLAHEC